MADTLETQIATADAVIASGLAASARDGVSETFADRDSLIREQNTRKRTYWKRQGHSRHRLYSQDLRVAGGSE